MSSEFNVRYASEQLRRSRHPLRRLIKSFYLRSVLRYVQGRSIDFGCGAGQLLARLPNGSIGLEVNPGLIAPLKNRGLNVAYYDAEQDRFQLADLPENRYSTFIMAHVLEHFVDAPAVLRTLFASCRRLAVRRFILVVPGWRGYLSDPTHRTFVDYSTLEKQGLLSCGGYSLSVARYFPINRQGLGKYFVFHEFLAVFDRAT